MPRVRVSVGVADEHLQKFTDVLDRLKKAGMDIERENRTIGLVSGSVEATGIDALRTLEGITSVEESRQFHLRPPDSKLQ